ncbi:MAG: C25 family cysteine peptidase, partial [Chitinophagaceae bacterium]
MKRFLLLILLALCVTGGYAQYNNEWIDYNKSYHKFKVGTSGLYRISKATLQNIGLGAIPAEQFQLWRNGKEVPLYSSLSNGVMNESDFLEFYGEMNDGKPDNKLYKKSENQPDDKWSLQTDSATYFLTVNTIGTNARIKDQVNNVAGNSLQPDPYFMYTFWQSYRTKINQGFAAIVGEYVYSATYDRGEGFSSRDIYPNSPLIETNKLFIYPGGPDGTMSFALSGNALNARNYRISINGNPVVDEPMSFFTTSKKTVTVPLSILGNASGDVFTIANTSANVNDRMVIAAYKLTYPRIFDFGGTSLFEFNLPASALGNYLEITNFNYGSAPPILYDVSNNERYIGDLDVSGKVRFALKPSVADRKLILMNASLLKSPTEFIKRNFINFADNTFQGDYLIISNPILYNENGTNFVESYRNFRSSTEGGSYQAKIYDIDQLIDQFSFGIKSHPLGVKNFISYAKNKFTVKPKFVFIIGRGITYSDYRKFENFPITEKINLVPTFGSPGSDNLLASEDFDPVPEIPIGRLSVVNGSEIDNYLQKVKQYDLAKTNGPQTIANKAWMKNAIHAVGGSDPFLQSIIYGYMQTNKAIIEDTLLGSNVSTYSKITSQSVEQLTSDQLTKKIEEGIGLLTYFGHSSSNTLEFNIDEPSTYNNQGKYPLFFVNGCYAGNYFVYDTLRLYNSGFTLSEKYTLAKERGSIGFIASTHFGLVNYLNIYTNTFYNAFAKGQYGKSLGELIKETTAKVMLLTGGDYYATLHAEEINLHGDPAMKIYSFDKPDYVIEDQLVKVNPSLVSVVDNQFELKVGFMNLGKAIKDSVDVLIQRQLPNGDIIDLFNGKRLVKYADSLSFIVPINPLVDKGENKIIVTLDKSAALNEISESNNSLSKSFNIIEDELRPISPYNYAIVNDANVNFYASIANPFAKSRDYVMEIDTTEQYNSAFKKSVKVNAGGGLIQFLVSGLNLTDKTVYYWRTAPVPETGQQYVWNQSSFVYLKDGKPGYNQSHYYQYQKNTLTNLKLDEDRVFRFDSKKSKLGIKTGIYPYFLNDALEVIIDDWKVMTYGCKYNSIQILVYDSVTFKPWTNKLQSDGYGKYGSVPPCIHGDYAFEFAYADPMYRKNAIAFLESIPKGMYVSITNLGSTGNASFISDWMKDTATLGSGNSLYHSIKSFGFLDIDKFTTNLPFLFFGRKGIANYPIYQNVGVAASDYVQAEFNVTVSQISGKMESPWFGPAVQWNELHWDGKDVQNTDKINYELWGRDYNNNVTFLGIVQNAKDTTLSFVDPTTYPYLKLKQNNSDSLVGTPYQLEFWRLNAILPPEGAMAPNIAFKGKDTVEIGEPYVFEIAFKNISQSSFDSIDVNMILTDSKNNSKTIVLPKQKALNLGDTILFRYVIDTKNLGGNNN